MSAISHPPTSTPQETGALILRAQVDAALLLRIAENEQRAGAAGIYLSLEQVRDIAQRMQAALELKEAEHLAVHGGRRG
jgi:hypothetical protein